MTRLRCPECHQVLAADGTHSRGSQKHEMLAPRFRLAEQLIEGGASLMEIERSTGLKRERIGKIFGYHGWSPEQAGRFRYEA